MRILIINHRFLPYRGSSAEAVARLLEQFSIIPGLEIEMITTSQDEQYYLQKMGDSITIHLLPIIRKSQNPEIWSKKELREFANKAHELTKKLAKKNSYDLLHSFYSFPGGYVGFRLKRKFKLPYMISLRASDVAMHSEKFSSFFDIFFPSISAIREKADILVANSDALRTSMMTLDEKKQIQVIYDGFCPKEFFPCLELRNPDQFYILCVSDITPENGVRFLIQAFNVLSDRYSQIRLLVIGDGSEKITLEELVLGMGMEDKVAFLERGDDGEKMLSHYQKSDVFVLPSLNEKLSDDIKDAMSCALPVIATDAGSNKEFVCDGKNGLIVRDRNYNDLVEKIEKLILDKDLRLEMGRESRKIAESMSWENIAKEYLQAYEQLINIDRIREEK